MQGALGVLENALRRNARPLTPISKAINELQSQISKPRDGASNPTPIKLWSSVRPPAEQMKKTLRFASQLEEVAASADVDKVCIHIERQLNFLVLYSRCKEESRVLYGMCGSIGQIMLKLPSAVAYADMYSPEEPFFLCWCDA